MQTLGHPKRKEKEKVGELSSVFRGERGERETGQKMAKVGKEKPREGVVPLRL